MPGRRLGYVAGIPRLAGWLALVVLTGLVFWPGLDSFLVRDDFAQIAYARLLGSPWVLFIHDHFIPAGAFFRPLGFAVLWVSTAVAGTHVAGHYAIALVLHLMVSMALLGVLRRTAAPHMVAVLLALLFALHPLAIGTSLWLSDRFDLLAALFMLLALRMAWDFRVHPGPWKLSMLLACVVLAMLAKETGLVIVVPVSLLWLAVDGWRPRLLVSWRALLAVWMLVPLYLIWRAWVLGGLGGGDDIGAQAPIHLLLAGAAAWLGHLPGYLLLWPRLALWQKGVAVLAVLVLMVTWLVARRHGGTSRPGSAWRLAGLALFVLPAAVQAPIAAISAAALTVDMSPIDAAMQARFYYIAMCGLVILMAGALDRPLSGVAKGARVAALATLVAIGAFSAHRLAADYSRQSQAIRPLADAAIQAMAELDVPRGACQIYFLDTEQPPEWGLYAPLDSIVKALTPDLGRIDHCLVQTESAPYFHLLRRGALDNLSVTPLSSITGEAFNVPEFAVGDMAVVALNLHPGIDARQLQGASFLVWQDGVFRDVTRAVHAGERTVRFQCIRSPEQCPSPGAHHD